MNVWIGTSVAALLVLIIIFALRKVSIMIIDQAPRKPQLSGPEPAQLTTESIPALEGHEDASGS
jgi:Flp pilus assembly protein protease CpaA